MGKWEGWTGKFTVEDKANKYVAQMDGVQNTLEFTAFEVAARAEQILLNHRQQGHASIDIEDAEVDFHVALDDTRGGNAAAAIEYGRAGYVDEEGNVTGASEGLYVLHQAARLRKRPKKKLPKQRVKKRRSNKSKKKGGGLGDS